MNLKNVFAITLLAAANHIAAQQVPPPHHLSQEILAAGQNRDNARTADVQPENMIWTRSVWREIDVKQKVNKVFDPIKNDDHSFYNALINGVTSGRIKAYRDDRFEIEIQSSQLVPWLGVLAREQQQGTNELQIVKFQVKEDSVHLRHEDKIEVRRLAIMPVALQAVPNGGKREQPLFWISYQDALPYLAEVQVASMPEFTWADVLESNSFYATSIRVGNKKENK